jgi:DNA-binding transcriptional regulator YiaG
MMGKAQRDKGMRFEREVAKELGGTRVPLSGAMGGEYIGDVKALGLTIECKARKDGFKQLYKWLSSSDALVIKADGKENLFIIRTYELLRLLNIDHKSEDELEIYSRLVTTKRRLDELEAVLAKQYNPLSFGERLLNIRKRRKQAIKNVADFIGVTQEVVSDWENNVSRPTLEEIILLSRFYCVSSRYIELGLIERGEDRLEREQEPA